MPLPSRSAPPPSASPSAHWVDRRGALRLCGSAWVLAGMATGGAAILGDAAWANPRVAPRADSPEVGVDPALVASGLTTRWGQAMRRDLGWAARWTPLPSGALLRALAQGDIDMGLFLSHPQADRLAQEGLIHDRHVLARTDVLLLGPQVRHLQRKVKATVGDSAPVAVIDALAYGRCNGAAILKQAEDLVNNG